MVPYLKTDNNPDINPNFPFRARKLVVNFREVYTFEHGLKLFSGDQMFSNDDFYDKDHVLPYIRLPQDLQLYKNHIYGKCTEWDFSVVHEGGILLCYMNVSLI